METHCHGDDIGRTVQHRLVAMGGRASRAVAPTGSGDSGAPGGAALKHKAKQLRDAVGACGMDERS
jgi:hypothetical protein